MDILLILPNVYLGNRIGDHESKEPLGLLYLAAVLRREGYNVFVLQADFYGLSVEQIAEIALLYNPAVIGISITQRASTSSLKLIKLLRHRGFIGHITSGGYLPSLCTHDFLEQATEIDSAIIGEGEETFLELVRCLDNNKPWQDISGLAYRYNGVTVINKLRPFIQDIDSLPFPARDLLNDAFGRMGYATLVSSRGCYGRCTFCPQNAFKQKNLGPHWRGRSPINIVDEIEAINKNYGIDVFKFNDDDIFGPGKSGRQRLIGICEEIIERGIKSHFMAYCRINDIEREVMTLMRQAGFERLLVGIESSVPEILQKYKKDITPTLIEERLTLLEELGFSVIPGFMMFNPYSSTDQLRTDLMFLRRTKSFGVSISKTLKVHDSTKIKNDLLKEDRLKLVPFYQGYHEYSVDNDIARVFKTLKLIWSKLIDPMQANYQHVVTKLKKTKSFNTRHEYDQYLQLIWELEASIMDRLIMWVQNSIVDPTKVKELIIEVQDGVSRIIKHLRSKETPDISSAHKFRLYPFQLGGNNYCLDLVSSQISLIDANLINGLHALVSEQSIEKLEPNMIAQIRALEKKKLINPVVLSQPQPLDINALNQSVMEILRDHSLNSMKEHYFWGKK